MATITCLHPDVKEALIEACEDLEVPRGIINKIKKLTDCEDDEKMIEFGRGGKKGASTRTPSAYQKHTSECMKSGKSMAECAAKWKDVKAKGGK